MKEQSKDMTEISTSTFSPIQNQNLIQYTYTPFLNINTLNPINLKYEMQYPNYNMLYINYLFQNFLLTQQKNFQNTKKIINNEEDEKTNNNLLLCKKKKRNGRLCTECPHKFTPHYAKGMCSNCYHSKGRSKKPWNCPHLNKAHYALGLCQNCYQINYIKKQSINDNKKFVSYSIYKCEKNNINSNDSNDINKNDNNNSKKNNDNNNNENIINNEDNKCNDNKDNNNNNNNNNIVINDENNEK